MTAVTTLLWWQQRKTFLANSLRASIKEAGWKPMGKYKMTTNTDRVDNMHNIQPRENKNNMLEIS